MHCLNLVLHHQRICPPPPETIVSGGNQRGRKHTASNDSKSQERVKYTSHLVPKFLVNAGKYSVKFSQLDGDS